jgi:hypothetical protein
MLLAALDPPGLQVFEELKRLDEGETYDDLQFRSSADTLSHVLELVRIHKVRREDLQPGSSS